MPGLPALLLVLASANANAATDRACTAFHWDMKDELAAMATTATALAANTNIQQAGAPLQLGKQYVVTLAPETQVAFMVPPGRPAKDAAPQGGILYFDVRKSGRYRFSLDTGHWLDVIDSGEKILDGSTAKVLESVGHDSAEGCAAIHKVVAFDLEVGTTYRVHLSGRAASRVNLVVTRGDDSDSAAY